MVKYRKCAFQVKLAHLIVFLLNCRGFRVLQSVYSGHIQASKILHILFYIILCHTSVLLKHVKSNCYYLLSRCFELTVINLVYYYILFNNEAIKFHMEWSQRMSYPQNRGTRILVFLPGKKQLFLVVLMLQMWKNAFG